MTTSLTHSQSTHNFFQDMDHHGNDHTPTSDCDSLTSSTFDHLIAAHDEDHHEHDDTSTSASTVDYSPPTTHKALFFNTAIPISYHKHHLRLSSDDGSFSTILKEDELCTVRQVINLLQRKYEFEDIILVLVDEETGEKRALQDTEKIVRVQNSLFRSMWVKEEQLPKAALIYDHHFKFLIHKF